MKILKELGAALIMLFVLTIGAHAQACPGGFWGNGQCIGACDSPLINPNVDLKFYSWSCFGGSNRQICTDGAVFCYPEYTAYDRVYGQYCGVITDYGDGECTFPYLGQLLKENKRAQVILTFVRARRVQHSS